MNEQLDRIGRQLEAIELALAAIQDEHDHEQRTRWLAVVGRASTAVRQDYEDVVEQINRRPVLRLLKGGGVAAATTGSMEWLRHAWRKHPQAGVAAAAATLVLAAAVVAVETHPGPSGGTPYATGSIASAPPSATGTIPTLTPPATTSPAQFTQAPGAPESLPPQVLPPPRPATSLLPASVTGPAPTTHLPPSTPPPGTVTPPPSSRPPAPSPPPGRPSSSGGVVCLKVVLRPILGVNTCILNT